MGRDAIIKIWIGDAPDQTVHRQESEILSHLSFCGYSGTCVLLFFFVLDALPWLRNPMRCVCANVKHFLTRCTVSVGPCWCGCASRADWCIISLFEKWPFSLFSYREYFIWLCLVHNLVKPSRQDSRRYSYYLFSNSCEAIFVLFARVCKLCITYFKLKFT
jgi:hypothetical protein